MKILKRTNGTGTIYDTENIAYSMPSDLKPGTDKSLHLSHKSTDKNFLLQFFPVNHPVFILFEQSYYYDLTQHDGPAKHAAQ